MKTNDQGWNDAPLLTVRVRKGPSGAYFVNCDQHRGLLTVEPSLNEALQSVVPALRDLLSVEPSHPDSRALEGIDLEGAEIIEITALHAELAALRPVVEAAAILEATVDKPFEGMSACWFNPWKKNLRMLFEAVRAWREQTPQGDIGELRRLALAASPGPWKECGREHGGCSCGMVFAIGGDHPVAEATVGDWGDRWPEVAPFKAEVEPSAFMAESLYGTVAEDRGKANAAFIATVNPATILELIDELVMLRAGKGRP